MSAAQLLHDLNRLGIRLEAVGERIRYCPQNALTPDLLDQLRTFKFELLTMIRQEPAGATINLADANAVWQAALDELKGDEMFPDELLQALRAARVAWGPEQRSTESGRNN